MNTGRPRVSNTEAQENPAPWVSDGKHHEARGRASQWLTSHAFGGVLSAFDGDPEMVTDPVVLRRWSGLHLDSREGRERHQAQSIDYTTAQLEALHAAAGPLGLLRTPPPTKRRYALTAVLGGTVTGNTLRMQFAAGLGESGLDLGRLVGSAASRQLTASELALLADATRDAPVVHTEYEHLALVLATETKATRRHLLKADEADDAFASSAVEKLTRDGATVGWLLRAPSRRTGRRADTLDAVRFARQELGDAEGGTLVITSAIYAPYTYFLLAALATERSPIEVVGTPTLEVGTRGQAQRFAQEIHATITTLPL